MPNQEQPTQPYRQPAGTGFFWALTLAFFLSGVAALIYQIVWAKEFGLVFGVTLFATSAVVTTFMAGLALGSLYFGRLVDRWQQPLLLFALIEAGIGAFALIFPALLHLIRHAYVVFYGPFGDNHYVMSLVRFVLSFLGLIVPTSLMGGTLPIIVRASVERGGQVSPRVAGLYAANNLGAFLGCVAAGYVLLERVGPVGTLRLAAALNVAAVAIALYVHRRAAPTHAVPAEHADDEMTQRLDRAPLSRPLRVALWVFGLEGVTSLVYQMAWIRMLVFFVRTNIFGVTAIVSTFLAGLSLGAFVSRRRVARMGNPYRALGLIEVGIAVCALCSIGILPYLLGVHDALLGLHRGPLSPAAAVSLSNFAVTFLVILVPTALMGATLPVVSRIYISEARSVGRKMGVLGCLDTVGSIFGAFAGGFILIPMLGMQRTIIATAILNLALAAWVFAADPISQRRLRARAGLIGSVAGMVCAAALLLARPTPPIKFTDLIEKPIEHVVEYREDEVASVSVVEREEYGRSLWVDDIAVGGADPEDRPSHELVLHIPLLIHDNPRRVLVIGLGLGLSVGACLAHDVDVDVVELSRSVVGVNPCFEHALEPERGAGTGLPLLSHPRVRVRIEDGRNFALASNERYDVIHVGGFHPVASSGGAAFYTVEFYQDCQRLLTPNGIFTQWLPIHSMNDEDLRMILRSFRAGFPHATVWHKYSSDFCMLMGTVEPLRIDVQTFRQRMERPAVLEHLKRCRVEQMWDLLDSFCFGGETIDRAVGEGPLHTDRHPYVEYHGLRVRTGDWLRGLALLGKNRRPVWPYLTNLPEDEREKANRDVETWFRATQELLRAQYLAALPPPVGSPDYDLYHQQMRAAYDRAMVLNPADLNARFLWKRQLARHYLNVAGYLNAMGRRGSALENLRRAAETSPDTRWGAEAKYILKSFASSGSSEGPTR